MNTAKINLDHSRGAFGTLHCILTSRDAKIKSRGFPILESQERKTHLEQKSIIV